MVGKKGYGLSRAEAARTFQLLGDETRLRVLMILEEKGESHVGALADDVGLSQPAVSRHLGLLRLGGLVECRRAGQQKVYRILAPIVKDLLQLVCED